jgi:hypothetical protein
MFRLWASKHMSHFCGVSRMQFACGFWYHSWCTRCQQDNETTEHVILCSGQGANQEWFNRVTNLGVWLIEEDTHPSIHCCISESLMQHLPLNLCLSFQSRVPFHSIGTRWNWMAKLALWKGKSQNIGVTCNFSIIMIHIPNDQWIDGHQVWFLIY